MESMQRQAWQEEDSFRRGIEASPFRDRLVDCKSAILNLDYDGIRMDTICLSFRFDVGNGYSLDISSMYRTFPSEVAAAILRTIIPLIPMMKDGVEIEVDNVSRYYDSASDLFKTQAPGDAYSCAVPAALYETSREDIDEIDGMVIRRILYLHCSYLIEECGGTEEFYSIGNGCIHVLFPWKPTEADLEWLSGIKPVLEDLTRLVSREGKEDDGTTTRVYRYPDTDMHFVLWRDIAEGPNKTI